MSTLYERSVNNLAQCKLVEPLYTIQPTCECDLVCQCSLRLSQTKEYIITIGLSLLLNHVYISDISKGNEYNCKYICFDPESGE